MSVNVPLISGRFNRDIACNTRGEQSFINGLGCVTHNFALNLDIPIQNLKPGVILLHDAQVLFNDLNRE